MRFLPWCQGELCKEPLAANMAGGYFPGTVDPSSWVHLPGDIPPCDGVRQANPLVASIAGVHRRVKNGTGSCVLSAQKHTLNSLRRSVSGSSRRNVLRATQHHNHSSTATHDLWVLGSVSQL